MKETYTYKYTLSEKELAALRSRRAAARERRERERRRRILLWTLALLAAAVLLIAAAVWLLVRGGGADEPAPIPPAWEAAVQQAALTVYRALGLGVYSRADFIVDETGTPWFLEINTLPGMTPTSLVPQEAAVVGLDYPALCQTIVEESLRLRGKVLEKSGPARPTPLGDF